MKTRKLLVGVVAVLLWLTVAGSANGAANGEGEGKKGEAGEVVADGKTATVAKSATDSTTLSTEEQLFLLNEKVRKLEEIVERQQRIIEALQPKAATEVKAAATDAVATSAAVPATAATTESAQAAAPADEQTKKLDSLYKAFGQFNISGDLRLRFDTQHNLGFDAPTQLPDRNRGRVRARLQIAGQFYDHFDWAIRLASGTFTNPLSTNQTFTDFFNRKPFGLDRAFIRYDSKGESMGVILQAGKFDYPFKRTELVFDNDLQPEGAAETLYFKTKGFLKEARLVAFQLPFNEVAAGKDSVLYGGQLQSTVGKDNWTFTGSASFYNFNQTDSIARAVNASPLLVGGGLEFGTTNRVRLDSSGKVIGFLANFNILDVIGEVRYNGYSKFPIALLFDYARNMSSRLDRLKERNGYWTEFRVGQLKERGDMEFTYTFARTEQDAVLSAFNFDDFLATNSRNSRFTVGYTINKNVFLQVIGLFNERFNTIPGRESRVQKRFQFDMNYRF